MWAQKRKTINEKLTKMIFINVDWYIGIDWLFIWFPERHVVSLLKIGGPQSASLADFYSYCSRKHFACSNLCSNIYFCFNRFFRRISCFRVSFACVLVWKWVSFKLQFDNFRAIEFLVTHNREISLGRKAHFLDGISDAIETLLMDKMEHSQIVEPTKENKTERKLCCFTFFFFLDLGTSFHSRETRTHNMWNIKLIAHNRYVVTNLFLLLLSFFFFFRLRIFLFLYFYLVVISRDICTASPLSWGTGKLFWLCVYMFYSLNKNKQN